MLADRARRTWTLAGAIVLWGVAMLWSASVSSFQELLLARVLLGAVTAAAGPLVASLVGDYFAASERGRIYGYILAGELLGSGVGFAVTGDIATLSSASGTRDARAAGVPARLDGDPPARTAARRNRLSGQRRRETRRSASPQRPTDAQQLARERGIRRTHGSSFTGTSAVSR